MLIKMVTDSLPKMEIATKRTFTPEQQSKRRTLLNVAEIEMKMATEMF